MLISKLSCCKGGLCIYVSVYTNSGVLLGPCHCIANVLYVTVVSTLACVISFQEESLLAHNYEPLELCRIDG